MPRIPLQSRSSAKKYSIYQSFLRDPQLAPARFTTQFLDKFEFGSTQESTISSVNYSLNQLYMDGTCQGVAHNLPISYGYGTGRRLGSTSLAVPDWSDTAASLFSDDVGLRNAEEWLLQLDYSASKRSDVQPQQKLRLELVMNVLINVLPDVSEIQFTTPTYEKPNPRIEFKTHYGWVPLSQLGYGYRTMIAWVVDFASRLVERYPDSPDPLAEPAVVLVDEIDLHLHPKWQRELIGFLTERFPNTQFIVTAHSPLIVQAAPDANISLLKRVGDHVVIENNPETIRGWRVDQILTSDLFGLETARPPETETLLLRRKQLLTKRKLTKADKKELEEINGKIGPLPTGESFQQAKTMTLIEKSLDLLKEYQGTKS
jgi:predicted ATP-binding protein involved in virulence